MDKSDRCDRCGAQAKVKAVLTNGELLFCGHHFDRHQPALVANPNLFAIEDDRKESVDA